MKKNHLILAAILFIFIPFQAKPTESPFSLSFEIQVVPKVRLSIMASSLGQQGSISTIDFGLIDAFGINKKSNISTEVFEDGALYYVPLGVEAGVSGGATSSLSVSILSSTPQMATQWVESALNKQFNAKNLEYIISGAPRTIDSKISGSAHFDRMIGVFVRPENAAGPISAEIQYSLNL